MIIQDIKLACRNILKNKFVSGINILGLTLGISMSMLIFSYVKKEVSTDNFIPNRKNIYALMNRKTPHLSLEMAQLAKTEVPEIIQVTSCQNEWAPQVFFEYENNRFKIENLLVADSTFFDVFQFEPVWGEPSKALLLANKVVLTQSLARKIFGDMNPVGEIFTYNSTFLQHENIEVGAVIKDFPHSSSWRFSAVLSIKTDFKIGWYANNLGWGQQCFPTFVSLPTNSNIDSLNKKLANISLESVPNKHKKDIALSLLPFTELYFNSPKHDIIKHGNRFALSVIEFTGLLIIFLACINYINLVTAQRNKRNKTVGIIKTLGGKRRKVIEMLVIESALTISISLVLFILVSQPLIVKLNQYTNSHFTFSSIFSGWNSLILVFIVLFTLTLTGLIPGFVLSKNKPSLLLNKNVISTKSIYLRNCLLALQFTFSISLIAAILVINRQNNYLLNVDSGFEKDGIIYAETNDDILNNIQAFNNELKNIAGIKDITYSEEVIGSIDQNWGLDVQVGNEKVNLYFALSHVTPNFFDFFAVNLIDGTGFNENSENNMDIIFNSATFLKNPDIELLNTRLPLGKSKGLIIGKVENFNFESMHVPIRPIGFMCSRDGGDVVYLKLNELGKDFSHTLGLAKNVWDKYSPNFPFEYHFLDQSWEAKYLKDKQFQKVLSYATLIFLILSCLGLTGLTFFIIENKTKEIGIRKVNGAKISEILTLLNIDFVKWVCMAFIIATPLAYYVMQKWLENFAYKTELSWWIFALAGVLALGIALVTVSVQSWKAATRNPVESLRYE